MLVIRCGEDVLRDEVECATLDAARRLAIEESAEHPEREYLVMGGGTTEVYRGGRYEGNRDSG